MNIYAKASSRACGLDRCLWSIGEHLTGYGSIIVLDDGLDEKYLEVLVGKYPDVEFRQSPHGREKQETSRHDDLEQHREFVAKGWDPAPFWHSQITLDTEDYILITEEDSWFRHRLDLSGVEANMSGRDAILLLLTSQDGEANSNSKVFQFTDQVNDELSLDYYLPRLGDINDTPAIFVFNMAIYAREYWCSAVGRQTDFLQEFPAYKGALDYLAEVQRSGRTVRFATTGERVGGFSRLSTSRTDSGGRAVSTKIDHSAYNHAIDEAWLRGEFDPLTGFPDDWPETVLYELYAREMGRSSADEWRGWRQAYRNIYLWTE